MAVGSTSWLLAKLLEIGKLYNKQLSSFQIKELFRFNRTNFDFPYFKMLDYRFGAWRSGGFRDTKLSIYYKSWCEVKLKSY